MAPPDVMFCGPSMGRDELPDAGESRCCMGAAMFGPERCTCWVDVVEPAPAGPLRLDLSPEVAPEMCFDCAFRPGSPERSGDPSYENSTDGAVDSLVRQPQPFFCHQGMPRVVRTVHEPTGTTVELPPSRYVPVIQDGVPFQADGTPGRVCAGWAARRLNHIKDLPVTPELYDEAVRLGYLPGHPNHDEET